MWRFIKEFLVAMFWVFVVLIAGYYILGFLVNRNIPLVSSLSSWIENRASGSN